MVEMQRIYCYVGLHAMGPIEAEIEIFVFLFNIHVVLRDKVIISNFQVQI